MDDKFKEYFVAILNQLENRPFVVRCEDCINYYDGYCNHWDNLVDKKDYCSNGEHEKWETIDF